MIKTGKSLLNTNSNNCDGDDGGSGGLAAEEWVSEFE